MTKKNYELRTSGNGYRLIEGLIQDIEGIEYNDNLFISKEDYDRLPED